MRFAFLRGIGGWLASDFSNLSHTWFLDRFWVTLEREELLFDSPLPIFWRVNLCSFSSLVSTRRLTWVSSAYAGPCVNIKHLKSSAVSSASLKSLQSLLTDAANVRKSCWLSLVVFRHFQRLWNKVVLGPNSSDRSLIVSEQSKSLVFLGNMKSTNLLCSVVPQFS